MQHAQNVSVVFVKAFIVNLNKCLFPFLEQYRHINIVNTVTLQSRLLICRWVTALLDFVKDRGNASVLVAIGFGMTNPLDGDVDHSIAHLCDVFLRFCHFPMLCPRSGMVLDCIDY